MLHCIPEDGASFEIASGAEKTTSGFCELGRYSFTLTHKQQCTLVIDEVEIECARSFDEQRWSWQPGFYAGPVLAYLLNENGQELARYRFDVSPDPNKLGSDVFQSMVDSLYAFSPRLLVGTEWSQFNIGSNENASCLQLQYARIRHWGPHLLTAIQAVAQAPISKLVNNRALRPVHQVRKVDRTSLISIARNYAAVDFLRNHRGMPYFDVPHSKLELDAPPNRALYFIIQAVLRRISRVKADLVAISNREKFSPTRSGLAPRKDRRLAFLSRLHEGLTQTLKCRPLNAVRRPEISAAGLNAISAHPAYSRTFRIGSRMLRPGIAGVSTDEQLWLSPTWEIYERWCYLRICELLQEILPQFDWKHRLSEKPDNMSFEGSSADCQMILHYQLKFPAFDQSDRSDDAFFSISKERYPDIVLTSATPASRRMIVFDAKYRVARSSVLDAMESAHIYRDSLRWQGQAPQFCVLLVPSEGDAPWLEKLSFLKEHHVGAIKFSPGQESGDLSALLRNFSEPSPANAAP